MGATKTLRRVRRSWRRRHVWLLVLTGLLGVYGLGFGVFMLLLPKPLAGLPPVDGLVVFTGGEGRVRTALELVGDGFGGPVLISGVYPAVQVRELEGALALERSQLAKVMLDKQALTTRENMANTLRWADVWGLRHVGVVTSTYHAPRVWLLAWWSGATDRLTVVPVQPQRVGVVDLLREYSKLWLLPLMPLSD